MRSASLLVAFLGVAFFIFATLVMWQPQHMLIETPSAVDETARGVFYALSKSPTTVVASSEHGRIFYSTDNGKSWKKSQTQTEQSLTDIFLLDEHLGWSVGFEGVILKTIDGGLIWKIVKEDSINETPLFAIWFRDVLLGLAVGADSMVYRTLDGGDTWHSVKLEYQTHLYAITQTDDGVIWIAGENHALFKSHDLGATWSQIEPPFLESFFGILPIDKHHLLTYGIRGRTAIFNDGGIVKNTKESDETLTAGMKMTDGRIVLAGQRGRILMGTAKGHPFKGVTISKQEDIAAITEVADAVIVAGSFGVLRIPKEDLGL